MRIRTSEKKAAPPTGSGDARSDFITYERYLRDIEEKVKSRHWKDADVRWNYHQAAAQLLLLAGIRTSDRILELGTMGIQVFAGSDTLDYTAADWPTFKPTYFHDARKVPWPIADGSYDTFIALRVFQHLSPAQRACFLEARRIARRALIVVPEKYNPKIYKESRGITTEDFIAWNDGVAPTFSVKLADSMGMMHYWHYDRFTGA